jgi:diguanylate cyclase (GGDEF)-like protein
MLIVLCAAVWWSVPGGWLKRRLLGTDAAGIMTRLLLPFIVVGPLALGLLWVAGHWAGLYDAEFGWALFTVSGIAGSVLIVALVGRRLARLDAERAAAQASLQQVNAELERHATELTEANARLEVLSNRDALTGLWNRRAFDARLREEHEAVLRYSGSLALLILDVDHFKEYNDAFGHPAGDELLKGLASVLADHARGTDCVARIGGEEFAILLRATELDGAHRQAERLRTEIERLNWPNRPITVSIGVAATNGLTQTAYGLLSAADRALYEAKRSGRNRVRVTPAPAERAAQRG